MANISEYIDRLQTLTQRNLEILQAINDSFFTKREHLQVSVGDANYVIPSFLCLENKINALQDDFDNLVYAPKTGEAIFNINGNSKRIEMKGYSTTPQRTTIDPSNIKGFNVEQNDVLKDFLTPNPYIKIDLQNLPNNISHVNVRKVVAKNENLKNTLNAYLADSYITGIEWAELYKVLAANYKEDEDYILYDTRKVMPIRTSLGTGTYTIKSIDNDVTDSNLDEFITITLHENLTYTKFDETIEVPIAIGDQLVTYDDSAKMEVVELNPVTRQIKVRVLNGDYLNLVEDPDNTLSSDNCKIKFFCDIDYQLDKYINIPLEEDQYVCAFVAALDDNLNVQAPWGGGIIVNTKELPSVNDSQVKFANYYNDNVKNIGDVLFEMSSAMTTSIMKYSKQEFEDFTQYIPSSSDAHLKVMQINTHLNSSPTAQNIRNLYIQKQDLLRSLQDAQSNINNLTDKLNSSTFSNVNNIRSTYETQLAQYNERKNEIVTNLSQIVNELNLAANNSDIPIENGKYHIRGYFNWNNNNDTILSTYKKHICGIKVQYRYKNSEVTTGSAVSMDGGFIFSDWNNMTYMPLNRVPSYNNGYKFGYKQYNKLEGSTYETDQDNGNLNEPSFNQIDIPISQGEMVDIRIKIVWDFGAPFVETTSAWSDIITISFPQELTKDLQLADIVLENNKDVEQNKFQTMLVNNGTIKHIEDSFSDQDVTYFHKPDNISSGFYTEERRVIPLRDKLLEISNTIIELKDIINGTNASNLSCSISIDGAITKIQSGKINNVRLAAYNDSVADENNIVTAVATLLVENTSQHVSYLYSMFPGNGSDKLVNLTKERCKFDLSDFVNGNYSIALGYPAVPNNGSDQPKTVFNGQTANQWITFRSNNPYTGEMYYKPEAPASDTQNAWYKDDADISKNYNDHINSLSNGNGMIVYPYMTDADYLKIQGNNVYDKCVINPGETVQIPIMIHYHLSQSNSTDADGKNTLINSASKTISFDLRTSLYNDPVNYQITFIANYEDSAQEQMLRSEKNRYLNESSITSIYRTTVK